MRMLNFIYCSSILQDLTPNQLQEGQIFWLEYDGLSSLLLAILLLINKSLVIKKYIKYIYIISNFDCHASTFSTLQNIFCQKEEK